MAHDPVLEIVNAITATGRKARRNKQGFKAQCPAHEDKTPSLEIDAGEKGAVLCCQAGCTTEAIMQALDLPMEFLFTDYGEHEQREPHNLRTPAKGALATYFYDDEQGNVLFRVERRKDKTFVQSRPDTVNPGEWVYHLDDTRRVPYRLQSVLGAIRNGDNIYIVEGEKDVHTLEKHGFVATCNPGGAGKFKRDFAEFFNGAHVVIVPDFDKPGEAHADQVAGVLRDVVRTAKVLNLPGLPEHGDVTDWLAKRGNNAEKLRTLTDECEIKFSNRPVIFHAADLMKEQFPDIVMAVPGIIAEGVTFLVGAPKIGKSWMALGLGLSVASGEHALSTIPVEQGPVLYAAMEDTPRRLQRRLAVMLGERDAPELLNFACSWPRLGAGGLDQLEAWLQATPDARMVIMDTWAKVKSAVDGQTDSMYTTDYAAVTAIKNLADEYNTAIVLVHHQRKAGDNDPLNTVAGSTGLTGAADATVVLTRPRGAEEGQLYVTGRDVEESRSIVSFQPETGMWVWLGEAEDIEERSTEDQVKRLLAAEYPTPMGPKEVADELDMKEGTAKWLLSKMATEGKISKLGRGKYTVDPNGTILPGQPPAPGGPIIVQGTTPAMPGLPAALQGPGVQSLTAVTDEEIEAALAEDEDFGEVGEE